LAWAAALVVYGLKLKGSNKSHFLQEKGPILIWCIGGFFLALVPSAMTNSEIPNAARVSLCWPLVSLLAGVLISEIQKIYAWSSWFFLAVAVAFASLFLNDYFRKYPERSKGMFGYWVLEDARHIKNDQDMLKFLVKYRFHDFHARYFLMKEENLSCAESYRIWKHIYSSLGEGKRY